MEDVLWNQSDVHNFYRACQPAVFDRDKMYWCSFKKDESNSNKNVFNASTQSGVTLSQLIETIENVTNSSLVKNIVPETRKDLELKRVGDTTKLTQLGWKCKVDLEAGITKTWNWLNA